MPPGAHLLKQKRPSASDPGYGGNPSEMPSPREVQKYMEKLVFSFAPTEDDNLVVLLLFELVLYILLFTLPRKSITKNQDIY